MLLRDKSDPIPAGIEEDRNVAKIGNAYNNFMSHVLTSCASNHQVQ